MEADVAIMGGGLAGLSLARQLWLEKPDLRIVVLERGKRPAQEASYKVGESSVEVAAYYYGERLGLKDHLDEAQLPKLGLRFFFPQGENSDVTKRLEIGPSDYPTVPSYQLDRGRFENYLHDLNVANGITIFDRARVQRVELRPGDRHEIGFIRGDEASTVTCRWVIDAAGRGKILKRKLDLEKAGNLRNGAVWFRLGAEVDINEMSDDPDWLARTVPSRRFSTNHFMGPGYWVWFIPLGSGSTSVGIVFDNTMHNVKEMNSFEKSMDWLRKHEPQCADLVARYRDTLQDFLCYQDYSYSCKQVYSADRWCITGEAGVFIDPFYSPGSDFIAYSNEFVTDLILRDLRGEDIAPLARAYDRVFLQLAEVVFTLYEGLYPKFGNGFVMTQKILWDSVIYLGVTCLLYFNRKWHDLAFLAKIDVDLARYNDLLRSVADHFKRQPIRHEAALEGEYVDLTKTFLFGRNLNKELLVEYTDDEALIAKLRENIGLLEALAPLILNNVDISRNREPAVDAAVPA